MKRDIFWYLPTGGDTQYLGIPESDRARGKDYLQKIAVTADRLGYDGILIPNGVNCLDPWITAAGLAHVTQRIKFLVSMRTGIIGPTAAARQVAALDQALGGRLMLNVVPGGDAAELAADGIFLPHAERFEAADEFLTVLRRVLKGEKVDFAGKYLRVEGAQNLNPGVQRPHPPIYFSGSSAAAHELAARHVDTYLSWGEPPAAVADKIADVWSRATRQGRTLRYGVRLHVIVRETTDKAWADAERLISHLTDEDIARSQAQFARMDSVNQARMVALHGGRRDRLEVAPNLWAGIGLVRGGAGTALVGDPETVAARLREYADLGVDTFILSGYPHLEESIRFAELVFPLLGKERVASSDYSPAGSAYDARSLRVAG